MWADAVGSYRFDMTEQRNVNRPLWAGLVVAVVGLVFNLGWFFAPPDLWFDDSGLIPMPEALLGWSVIAIGFVMMAWSLRHGARR